MVHSYSESFKNRIGYKLGEKNLCHDDTCHDSWLLLNLVTNTNININTSVHDLIVKHENRSHYDQEVIMEKKFISFSTSLLSLSTSSTSWLLSVHQANPSIQISQVIKTKVHQSWHWNIFQGMFFIFYPDAFHIFNHRFWFLVFFIFYQSLNSLRC